MMSQILITLSNPAEGAKQCKSWDDVQTLTDEVITYATPENLMPIQDDLKKLFRGVVNRARTLSNDTFISPPSYE